MKGLEIKHLPGEKNRIGEKLVGERKVSARLRATHRQGGERDRLIAL